jgi:hypothetical protein
MFQKNDYVINKHIEISSEFHRLYNVTIDSVKVVNDANIFTTLTPDSIIGVVLKEHGQYYAIGYVKGFSASSIKELYPWREHNIVYYWSDVSYNCEDSLSNIVSMINNRMKKYRNLKEDAIDRTSVEDFEKERFYTYLICVYFNQSIDAFIHLETQLAAKMCTAVFLRGMKVKFGCQNKEEVVERVRNLYLNLSVDCTLVDFFDELYCVPNEIAALAV